MPFLKQLLASNKECLIIILAGAVIATGTYLYSKGYSSGSKYIQEKWDREKAETNRKMLELKIRYDVEKDNFEKEKNQELNELKARMEEQQHIIDALNDNFNDQLQQSEGRAAVYQRLASSTESERKRLANHAARLDKALTEGIRLVKELSGTIELRDEQLRFIGKYLKDTYELIGK